MADGADLGLADDGHKHNEIARPSPETNVLREVQAMPMGNATERGNLDNRNPNQGVDFVTISAPNQSDGSRAAKTLDPVIADNISDKAESNQRGQEALIDHSKIINTPGRNPEQIAAIETLRTGPEALVTNKSVTTADGERLAGQMVKTPDGRIEFHPDNKSVSYEVQQTKDNHYNLRPIGDNKQAGTPLEIKSISNYRPADEPQPRSADRVPIQSRDNNVSSRSDGQTLQPRDRSVSTRSNEPTTPTERSVSSRANENNAPPRDRSVSSRTDSLNNAPTDRSVSSRPDAIPPRADRSVSSRVEPDGQQGRDNRVSSRAEGERPNPSSRVNQPEGKDISPNPAAPGERSNITDKGTRAAGGNIPGERGPSDIRDGKINPPGESPAGRLPGTRGEGNNIEGGTGRGPRVGEGGKIPDIPTSASGPSGKITDTPTSTSGPGGKIPDTGTPNIPGGKGLDIPGGAGNTPRNPPGPRNSQTEGQDTRGSGNNVSSRTDGIQNVRDNNNVSSRTDGIQNVRDNNNVSSRTDGIQNVRDNNNVSSRTDGIQNVRDNNNVSSRADGIKNVRDDRGQNNRTEGSNNIGGRPTPQGSPGGDSRITPPSGTPPRGERINDAGNSTNAPTSRNPLDTNQGPNQGTGRGLRGQEGVPAGPTTPFNPANTPGTSRTENITTPGQSPGRGQNSPEGRTQAMDNNPATTGNRQAAIDERNTFLNQGRTNRPGNENINLPPNMQPRRPNESPTGNQENPGRRPEGTAPSGRIGSDTISGGTSTGGTGRANTPGGETLSPGGTPQRPGNIPGGADISGTGRNAAEPTRPGFEAGHPNSGRGELRQGRAEISRTEITPGDGIRGESFRSGERNRSIDTISLAPGSRLNQTHDGAIVIGKGGMDLRDPKTRESLADIITKLQTGKSDALGPNGPRLQELVRGLGPEGVNQLKTLLLTADHKGPIRLDSKFDTNNQVKVLEILRTLSEGKGIKGLEGTDTRLPTARMAEMFIKGEIKAERLPTVDQQKALISEIVHGIRHLNHELGTINSVSTITLKDLIARGIGERNTAAEKIFSSAEHNINITNARFGERGQLLALRMEDRTDARTDARTDTRAEAHTDNAVRDLIYKLQSRDFNLTQEIASRRAEQQSTIKGHETTATGITAAGIAGGAAAGAQISGRAEAATSGPREASGRDTGARQETGTARSQEPAGQSAGRQIDAVPGGASRTDSTSPGHPESTHDTLHQPGSLEHKHEEEARIRKEREEKIKEQKEDEEERLDASKVLLAALKLKEMKEREEKEQQEKNDKNKKKKDDEKRIIYVTKPGDTLESIATRMLRDRSLGVLIFELNKSVIPVKVLNNKEVPNLKAGLRISIPNTADIRSFKARLIAETEAPGSNFASIEDELRAHFGDNWEGNDSSDSSRSVEEMRQESIKAQQARRANVESLLGSVSGKSTDSKTHQEYLVRLGDTLKSVATRHPGLQDVHLWKLLAQINNLNTDTDIKGNLLTQLKRGTTLKIPNTEDIRTFKEENIVSTRKTSTLGKTGELSIDPNKIKQATQENEESAGSISDRQEQLTQTPQTPQDEDSPLEFNNMQLGKNARLSWTGIEGDYESGVFLTLQAQADQKWLPIVYYEIYSDRSFRHEYKPNGTYTTREIVLGGFSALKAAENELKHGWLTYSNRFLSQLS